MEQKKKYTYIANWKMYKPYQEALAFTNQHLDGLKALSERPHTSIIICPSFIALHAIAQVFKESKISVGAQACSQHPEGAYTGQVSAASIKQIGADYCLVGHSETRAYAHLSNEDIGKQTENVFNQGLTPIICIGETKQAYENQKTFEYLKAQLDPVFDQITNTQNAYILAYEPVWAIGAGKTPDNEYLTKIFEWIDAYITKKAPTDNRTLIYGGSVKPENIDTLKRVPLIDGFLIGAASLDFQKFENIVL